MKKLLIKAKTITEIEVAPKDIGSMSWKKAVEECAKLGDGWILPDFVILKMLYKKLHLRRKGNFKNMYYWSSSELGLNTARHLSFSNGKTSSVYFARDYRKSNYYRVRPVKVVVYDSKHRVLISNKRKIKV